MGRDRTPRGGSRSHGERRSGGGRDRVRWEVEGCHEEQPDRTNGPVALEGEGIHGPGLASFVPRRNEEARGRVGSILSCGYSPVVASAFVDQLISTVSVQAGAQAGATRTGVRVAPFLANHGTVRLPSRMSNTKIRLRCSGEKNTTGGRKGDATS